jgi:HTH-type transcriptional regulator/antitoxin HigA
MIKRGWIQESGATGELESHVCGFFGVATLDEVPRLAGAEKRPGLDDIPGPELAWLFRVRQIARQMPTPAFDRAKLDEMLRALVDLRTGPKGVRHVPGLMHKAGIRFVIVERLPGSKVDGVCLWLDADSPVIGMSLRVDRIDNFWFVVRRELAHVRHGHGKIAAVIGVELDRIIGKDLNEEERIANDEATNFCVPQAQLRSFYVHLRGSRDLPERYVLSFAKRMGVHPGLVVGQLEGLTYPCELLRRHLVKVRHFLASSMTMDGWGHVLPIEEQAQ